MLKKSVVLLAKLVILSTEVNLIISLKGLVKWKKTHGFNSTKLIKSKKINTIKAVKKPEKYIKNNEKYILIFSELNLE